MVLRYVAEYGFPLASLWSMSWFCQRTTSMGLISDILIFPKKGMILSLIMYSLVSQVCSLMRGLISVAYTSTKSAKSMSMVPL